MMRRHLAYLALMRTRIMQGAMRTLSPAVVCVAVLASGCNGTPAVPTAPSSAASPTVAPTATFTVFGVVRAGNTPVADARVTVLDQQSPGRFVTTDGDGRYSIQAQRAQPWGMSPLVSASKPGYFADIRFTDVSHAAISNDTELDFELDALVQISLGETVAGRSFDSACSHWDYGTSVCQRFALAIPSAGLLEVTAFAPIIHFSIEVVGPDGTFAAYAVYPPSSPMRVQIPVDGGSTYQIRVTDPGKRPFELSTALRR
jgi:hypothetical protein